MKNQVICTLSLILGIAFGINSLHAQTGTKTATIHIIDAKLGTNVQDRMIIDENTVFPLNSTVFVWLKVTGGTSETITVKWVNGELTHETQLSIGGNSWRTWANKKVWKTGDWTVTVTDASGNVLKELTFKVE
jgi:hypothetical protein